MTKKLAGVVAFVGMSWAGSALAAEALLIRHEVLTVPIGAELTLKPGFFIGKAWTADGFVADASMNPDMRGLTFTAKAPGRTVVTAYNLREPNKRVEFEIVVSDDVGAAPLTPSLLPSENNDYDAPMYEPINAMDQTPAVSEPSNEETATETESETDMDPMN